eukprot:747116-Hanusia_phi.AAC.1
MTREVETTMYSWACSYLKVAKGKDCTLSTSLQDVIDSINSNGGSTSTTLNMLDRVQRFSSSAYTAILGNMITSLTNTSSMVKSLFESSLNSLNSSCIFDTSSILFSFPSDAQSVQSRSQLESCVLFSSISRYFRTINAPYIQDVTFVSSIGETISTVKTKDPRYSTFQQQDGRSFSWFPIAASISKDVIILIDVSSFLSVSILRASDTILGVIDALLSMVSPDDSLQIIVSGKMSTCLENTLLVPATQVNRDILTSFVKKAVVEELQLQTHLLELSIGQAWELFRNSAAQGYSRNCSRVVFLVTDGLVTTSEEQRTLRDIGPYQKELFAQLFMISLGSTDCDFCLALACKYQGLYLKIGGYGSYSSLRSQLNPVMSMMSLLLNFDLEHQSSLLPNCSSQQCLFTMAAPVVVADQGGQLALQGVLAIDFKYDYIMTKLSDLAETSDEDYHLGIFMTDKPFKLFFHPLVVELALSGNFFALDAQKVESNSFSSSSSLFERAATVMQGCTVAQLDRTPPTLLRWLAVNRKKLVYYKSDVNISVAFCWQKVTGTNLVSYILADIQGPTPVDSFHFSFSNMTTPYVASSKLQLPAATMLYHATFADQSVVEGLGVSTVQELGKTFSTEAFAVELAPTCFLDGFKYLLQSETAEQVTSINQWINRSLQDPLLYLRGLEGSNVLGAGLTFEAKRDVSLARVLASALQVATWNQGGGKKSAVIAFRSGVYGVWPGRSIPTREYTAADEMWFAQSVLSDGALTISRPHACAGGCWGGAQLETVISVPISLSPSTSGQASLRDEPVGVVGMSLGLSELSSSIRDALSRAVTQPISFSFFLTDDQGYFVTHSSPSLLEDIAAQSPSSSTKTELFFGDYYGEMAEKLFVAGFLVNKRILQDAEMLVGSYYTFNTSLLSSMGGVISGLLTQSFPAEFHVSQVLGTNLFFFTITAARSDSSLQRFDPFSLSYCGMFSSSCPSIGSPWINQQESQLYCNSTVLPPFPIVRFCPVQQGVIEEEMRGKNSSLRVSKQISVLQKTWQDCSSWAQRHIGLLTGLALLAIFVLAAAIAVGLKVRTRERERRKHILEHRDIHQQPVLEISDCAQELSKACKSVLFCSNSFLDYKYLIEQLEQEMVNLLVWKNRCKLREQAAELQLVREMLRQLKIDMHSIHLKTSRLETAAAEFEEAEQRFPQHEARAKQLKTKLDQLVRREMEETDLSLTNTENFYASHHPDIFGDLQEGETSTSATPRFPSSEAGPQLLLSSRMLAPTEMPFPSRNSARRQADASWGSRGEEEGDGAENGENGLMVTPRLPHAPAGSTEQRVEHFMKLAAYRFRERMKSGGDRRRPFDATLPPLVEVLPSLSCCPADAVQVGMESTAEDLTEDVRGSIQERIASMRRAYRQKMEEDESAVGPTMSERGRLLERLDAEGMLTDRDINDDSRYSSPPPPPPPPPNLASSSSCLLIHLVVFLCR